MTRKQVAPVLTLAVVLALVAAAWWLKQPHGTPTAAATPTATRAAMKAAKSTTPTATKEATSSGAPSRPGGNPPAAKDPESGLPWIDASALPKEAQQVLGQIDRGGPFTYAKDGVNFGNFEGRLPKKPGGFYREYTVPTPGEGDRGARRIVTGDHDRQFFWTADHYETFSRIRR